MARIRTIKPEFFTSDTVTELPLRARLTWIGLWTHCDDCGRCRDNVKLIKASVWPLDEVSLRDIAEDVETLIAKGLVYRYEADGKTYLQVTGWEEHQKVSHPGKSKIPAPGAGGQRKQPSGNPPEGSRDSPESSGGPPLGTGRGSREQGTGRGSAREAVRATAAPEAHPETLSHIPADWTPSDSDLAALGDDVKQRLGAPGITAATRKFIRHHQAKGTAAADYGPLWITWMEAERPAAPPRASPTQADSGVFGRARARLTAGTDTTGGDP